MASESTSGSVLLSSSLRSTSCSREGVPRTTDPDTSFVEHDSFSNFVQGLGSRGTSGLGIDGSSPSVATHSADTVTGLFEELSNFAISDLHVISAGEASLGTQVARQDSPLGSFLVDDTSEICVPIASSQVIVSIPPISSDSELTSVNIVGPELFQFLRDDRVFCGDQDPAFIEGLLVNLSEPVTKGVASEGRGEYLLRETKSVYGSSQTILTAQNRFDSFRVTLTDELSEVDVTLTSRRGNIEINFSTLNVSTVAMLTDHAAEIHRIVGMTLQERLLSFSSRSWKADGIAGGEFKSMVRAPSRRSGAQSTASFDSNLPDLL